MSRTVFLSGWFFYFSNAGVCGPAKFPLPYISTIMLEHSKILVRGRNFVVNNLEDYLSDAANLRGSFVFLR